MHGTGLMAQDFGDHPEAAMDRMRWIRQLAGGAPDRSVPARAGILCAA